MIWYNHRGVQLIFHAFLVFFSVIYSLHFQLLAEKRWKILQGFHFNQSLKVYISNSLEKRKAIDQVWTFAEEKDQEIQIGFPTDVKHVAHIGWDGPSANSTPSWVYANPFSLSRLWIHALSYTMNSINYFFIFKHLIYLDIITLM